jgi:formamidopyrimidine-DNA glycosylase
LKSHLLGATISGAEVLRVDSIAYPQHDEFENILPGHKFVDVARRGKYILITLDRGAGLAAHLRMSGRFLVTKKKKTAPGKFLRVRILLADGRELHFEDMRVFGRLWYKPADMTFEQVVPALAELGVEPLTDLTAAGLALKLEKKKQAVKSALLDQTVVAGIGNIYADESLFRAGIHPQRPAGTLKKAELERLVKEIRLVLLNAIENRGSTLSDYRDADGVNGNYQNQALVYGRTGMECRVCTRKIERVKIGGRSSHFCLKCQPLRASGRK